MHFTPFVAFGIFLYKTLPTESRKVTSDGLVLDGFKADAFRRITSHLIEKNIVKKLGSCAFRCSKNLECVSFNFGNPIQGTHDCELLRTDKYNSRESYVSSRDFHYFYRANKCMHPSPCQNNGSCYPDYDNDDYHCVCVAGYYGKHCEKYGRTCSEILSTGIYADGVYQIDPDGLGLFTVYCDMTTDGGGWTVFQKRFDGSVDFYRGWQDYKTGFGKLNSEFWLGLDKIHRLTKTNDKTLRVDLEDWEGNTGYAVYSSFYIADESDFYRLSVSGYIGTAGDSFFNPPGQSYGIHNGMWFSTRDKDKDLSGTSNCAIKWSGAWWYNRCYTSNLNGIYVYVSKENFRAACWYSLRSECKGLKATQMKLK